MKISECILNNLLLEIESLSSRLKNIQQTYLNISNDGLKERLIIENLTIFERVYEISSIAKKLDKRANEKISFSSLLVEKCKRTINEMKIINNLFFI